MAMRKAYNLICGQPWAITQEALGQMIAIARREESDLAAVEAQKAQRLANTSTVGERGGVAILPVSGPIFRYANLFSDISGATSVQILARDFSAALNDPSIRAIILNIDSPGGEVNGISEFAAMVYGARGKKPITAYVGGTGCSAAYWIASAADEIVADDTAILGSIGVIAALPADDSDGDIIFISSQSPRKHPDPKTEAGAADIQAVIDATAQVFVESVARYRGVSADTVLSSFGQGGVFVGQQAVEAGLADRLGSFEGVLEGLRGERQTTLRATAPSTSGTIAAGGLRANSRPITQLKEVARMSDDPRTPEAPPVDPPAPPAPPDFAAMFAAAMQGGQFTEQMTARFTAMFTEQMQTQIAYAQQQAEAATARKIAEFQAQQAIQQYAQHATTPTLQRQHALPIEAQALSTFLSSLNATQRKDAQGLFDRILDAGLVSFEEIGSQAEGAEEQSAKEQFDAAVQAKVSGGMSRLNAMQAVAKEQPALYTAYQAESAPARVAPPRPAAKKGGR
jgi:ClpP class serine protease